MKMNLLKYFNRKRDISPNNSGEYSLNEHGYINLSNQLIDSSDLARKYEKCDFSKSVFAHTDRIYWIENRIFIDSIFYKTVFKVLAEHGNKFYSCIFEDINFKHAILGYDSSCYTNCVFKNIIFGVFIKPQFKDCKFINCDFYNVDFQASNFENCEFTGKLNNVWFRGGFPTESLRKEFGYAIQNKMLNVSFEDAILHDVTFSDNCDLSTILFPKQGKYLFFDNWDKQLDKIIKDGMANQSMTIKNDIVSFVDIHKVHSEDQKYYILNVVDLLKEYDDKAVEIIKKNATQEI